MSRRTISVEIFRDIETPDVSIERAIAGLEAVRQIVMPLEIVARNGLLRLSSYESNVIRTDKLPPVDIRTDFGIILTKQMIVMPAERQMPIHDGNLTVGLTNHPDGASDYSIIDTWRTNSVINSTMHETGHLFSIPNGGETFDGGCHCMRPECLMYGELLDCQTTYCTNCTHSLRESAARMTR